MSKEKPINPKFVEKHNLSTKTSYSFGEKHE